MEKTPPSTRAHTHLSCKMHNCHILVLRAFGNPYILRTYSLFWSRLVYIILDAVNTDQSYLITSSFKQSRLCESITYLLHSAQPSSALFYTYTCIVNKRNPCFFSFLQGVSKCQVFCTTSKSRQACFEQIKYLLRNFCEFGVNFQHIKDILEVCVTWMRYMKVNLPFGFGSFDFWRRRREEKWVCHQGSLWAPWSCTRAPRACCKGR